MPIIWNDEYATHVASIDRQHQKLFSYINNLEDLINRGIYMGSEVDNLLVFMTEYVQMHFNHEEFCMNQAKCPEAEKNKKAHQAFVQFYDEFKQEYKIVPPEEKKQLIVKLQQVAQDWLKNHICKIDVSMRAFAH